MKNTARPLLMIAAMILGLFGSTALLAADLKGVSVEDPYVRAVPPGQKNTGAFMLLKNQDSQARSIVSAESDAAEVVELHTHIHENGMMKMRQIDSIDIPASGETVLKPGGLHVMLIGLKQPIVPDEPVEITLVYANGERQGISAVGRKLQMKMPMHGGMKH